ncbi:SDR family oxidoreductase [Nocardia vulneris]|uniref:3-beta hydroxysteroid dehydrogenase n=1 Tax=Nocardia vulneris TaxID=1141657 RepID=A0ABR4Z7M7_9NOCA|nr:SDR family oxidoreductase [Nocardia vulneris]KIA61353.1 3-beta hydroxysteroid dehydrogenase [Nocardia vulneris]
MRVFITGASGWIGSALVTELIEHGHTVVGLARSPQSADALTALGADVVRGTIDDLDLLQATTVASDGVAHLAFKHDIAFTGGFAQAATADRAVIDAVGEALAGSGKPFSVASGLLGVAPGTVATERDGHEVSIVAPGHPAAAPMMRRANAEATLALASRGIRSSVVRLAPSVHGERDQGFMASIAGIARDKGFSGFLGDGSNRWPAIHRSDAAVLFRLALEQAPGGSTLHGCSEQGVPIRTVAEAFGSQLDLPVKEVAPEDAATHFSWLAEFIGLDAAASNTRTRELLDWEPTGPGLIDDIDAGYYTTPR